MDSWEQAWPGRPAPTGSLGSRIAALRAERGWTQQRLADRLGISRVAVSHLETDLNVPGERTVALLAGCFRLEPHELVAGTTYPIAKADRLPVVAARWTEVEHRLAMFERDLWWLERDGVAMPASEFDEMVHGWTVILRSLRGSSLDRTEQEALDRALRALGDLAAEGRGRA